MTVIKNINILGIETSCDETGIAIYNSKKGLIANQLHSQVKLHEKYGGVVPELASRNHIARVIPLIDAALNEAKITINDINSIAYTQGPGLAGALLVGGSIALSLAYSLNIPPIAINHMEGHLLAPLLEDNKPDFPFVALLVSGGHTMLVKVNKIWQYEILADSLDDAVGEAFDKTAKILGLGYPGGPRLAELALKGDKFRFKFPRPMVDRPGLDFSFSGLKTYSRNTFLKYPKEKENIAYAFEQAATDVLTIKSKRALDMLGFDTLVVSGGVSANKVLRKKLNLMAKQNNFKVFYPKLEFCTDNGAMIALAGYYRYFAKKYDNNINIEIKPKWSLNTINLNNT